MYSTTASHQVPHREITSSTPGHADASGIDKNSLLVGVLPPVCGALAPNALRPSLHRRSFSRDLQGFRDVHLTKVCFYLGRQGIMHSQEPAMLVFKHALIGANVFWITSILAMMPMWRYSIGGM